MKSWPVRIAFIVIVAALVATILPGVREFLAIDGCLDRGGVYDYSAHLCRTDVQKLPSRSLSMLRAPDLGSVVVALAVAIAIARVFVTLDRRAAR